MSVEGIFRSPVSLVTVSVFLLAFPPQVSRNGHLSTFGNSRLHMMKLSCASRNTILRTRERLIGCCSNDTLRTKDVDFTMITVGQRFRAGDVVGSVFVTATVGRQENGYDRISGRNISA